MSKKHEAQGLQFKKREKEMRFRLPESKLTGIRLDGKSFHTFTKQFAEPYDLKFMAAMDATAIFVLEKLLTEALFAYVQSDEITIFFTDHGRPDKSRLFDGKMEKLLSTSASAATGGFMTALPEAKGVPIFDARLFQLTDIEELRGYLDWRRLDARKNAISMAAETLHTPKELDGMSTRQRLESLEGTDLEILPEGFFWGRLITREAYDDTVTFRHGKTGELKTIDAVRNRWISAPATLETATTLIAQVEEKIGEPSAA
jgi:tRNA(His) 5'-end guanylyltransferase